MEPSLIIISQGLYFYSGRIAKQGALIALSTISYRSLVELDQARHADKFPQPVLHLCQRESRKSLLRAPEDIHSRLEQKQATGDQVLHVQELTFTYHDAAQPSLRYLFPLICKGKSLGIIGGNRFLEIQA